MIRVQKQAPPADFNVLVKNPGQAFLLTNPNPTSKQFKSHRYWSLKLDDLRTAFNNGVCAYSAMWVPPATDDSVGTVDHYLPKVPFPQYAYDWDNYRFCSKRMNNYKDNEMDVMDPFTIQNGWFTLDFSSFMVFPADGLPLYLEQAVQATIDRLHLSDDDDLIQMRSEVVWEYVNENVTFNYLERRYPFIAFELERQGLRDTIKTLLRRPATPP